MIYHCRLCGRFTKQVKSGVGFPLTTAFPPDKPCIAATFPYAPFVCFNHFQPSSIGRVEYLQISFEEVMELKI